MVRGIRWTVGQGDQIKFCYGIWLEGDVPLAELVTDPIPGDLGSAKIKDMLIKMDNGVGIILLQC